MIHTASLDKQARNAWCREHGVFPQDLERWRAQAMDSLNDDASEQVSREQVRADRKRIKTLERELKHKEKAIAETAALLVLSKKRSPEGRRALSLRELGERFSRGEVTACAGRR